MKIRTGINIVLMIIVLSLICSGCFLLPERNGYVKILVYSGDPNSPTAVVKSMETLFVSIDGLTPFERYNIEILSSSNQQIAVYELNATSDGKLPPTAMWPEAGLPPAVGGGPVDPRADIQIGSYKVVLSGPNTNVTFPFSVISKNSSAIWSSDAAGKNCNAFQLNTNVYATGVRFPANTTVDVYITGHKDIWTNGETLLPYVTKVTTSTDGQGNLGPISLGTAAASNGCNNFDIVVDTNQNGALDDKDAVDKNGYVVQYPPAPQYRTMQIASNGHALDYTTHWEDAFYYPDTFNKDGSGTGFAWEGFGHGVFCILNPLIDDRNGASLVYWSQVRIWIITTGDFDSLAPGYDLTGKDVSDPLGRPDLITVQRTCSNGAGSILVWPAPLVDRRPGHTYNSGQGYVLIVEKPDASGNFDNIFDPDSDYVDGQLNTPGFSVVGL
jgi:hypothetical protein